MKLLSRLFKGSREAIPSVPIDPLDALLAAAVDDVDRRAAFYRALLEATLLLPGEIRDGELFVRPYDLHGRKALLLFSSPEKLRRGLKHQSEFVSLPGRACLEAARGFETLMLNYGAPNDKEFTRSEIEAILDGSIFAQSCGSGNYKAVLLGQPKAYPVPLMDHLRQWLPTQPDVRAAYIAQMSEEGSADAPRIVMAFDTDIEAGPFQELLDAVAYFADVTGSGDLLFTRLAADGLGEYLRTETIPFYRA